MCFCIDEVGSFLNFASEGIHSTTSWGGEFALHVEDVMHWERMLGICKRIEK